MPKLKQGTLSFSSAKRTNSTTNGKSQQRTPVTEKGGIKRVETPVEAKSDAKSSEVLDISSDEEGEAGVEFTVPAKRTRASTKGWSSTGTTKQALSQPSQSEKQRSSPAVIERQHLDIQDKGGRYRKYYNEVRSKMGDIPPSKHTLLAVNATQKGNSLVFIYSPWGGPEQDTSNASFL